MVAVVEVVVCVVVVVMRLDVDRHFADVVHVVDVVRHVDYEVLAVTTKVVSALDINKYHVHTCSHLKKTYSFKAAHVLDQHKSTN